MKKKHLQVLLSLLLYMVFLTACTNNNILSDASTSLAEEPATEANQSFTEPNDITLPKETTEIQTAPETIEKQTSLDSLGIGIFIKTDDDYYMTFPKTWFRTYASYLENGIYQIDDSDIPVLYEEDQLIIHGRNYSIIKAYKVLESGFTLPGTLSLLNDKDKNRLSGIWKDEKGDFVSQEIMYEFINDIPVKEYNTPKPYEGNSNYIHTGKYNKYSDYHEEYMFKANEGDEYIFGYYKNTSYEEVTFKANVKYHLYNDREGIELPINTTKDGYFIIDTSQLEVGNTYILTTPYSGDTDKLLIIVV